MANNRKISELPRARQITENDLIPIVNENVTKNITVKQLVGGDTGWQNIILKSNYPYPTNWAVPQYRVIGETVHLRGSLYIPFASNSKVLVDTNFVSYTEAGSLFFDSNTGYNLPFEAAPSNRFLRSNVLLSRRLEFVQNEETYNIPIVATVLFIINTNGTFQLAGIFDYEDLPTGIDSFGAHPHRIISTNIEVGQPFPDYSNVSVGVGTNHVISIPPLTINNVQVLAPENIDTTKINHLGGFGITLDGISYLNDSFYKYATFTKSLYE
jgi:hypothetical protein